MSVTLTGLVYDGFPEGGSEFSVILALADTTNEETGRCDPSVSYLAWKTRQSDRTVQYAIKQLIADGWVKIHLGQGKYGTNLYVLNRRKMQTAATARKDAYDEMVKAKGTRLHYPSWDEDFGVEKPREQVQDLQVQGLHPRKKRGKGVQTATGGVQTAASGGADGCTLTRREPEENQNKPSPAATPPGPDLRHHPCRMAYEEYWNSKNTIPMPWGADAAGALDRVLKNNPKLTPGDFYVFLRHRFKSDVNHSERPVTAIPLLTNFAGGPLDQYGKPKSGGSQKNDQQSKLVDTNKAGISDWLVNRGTSPVGDQKESPAGELHAPGRTLLG